MKSLLPKALNESTRITIIPTSSRPYPSIVKRFQKNVRQLKKLYPNTTLYWSKIDKNVPEYLNGSESERLSIFRKVIKCSQCIISQSGGTGCEDFARQILKNEYDLIKKNQPIVTGFSDMTFLINQLYFKTGLQTFHYSNVVGFFDDNNAFIDVLSGKTKSLSYNEKPYKWISAVPKKSIKGIAIGGNLVTFRDLVDIMNIKTDWSKYTLIIEDTGLDIEDLHHVFIALDQRGIFSKIKCLVIGKFNEPKVSASTFRFDFGKNDHKLIAFFKYFAEYVINPKRTFPLPILQINNHGHNLICEHEMIIPIGSKVTIEPSKRITFYGPFVE